jgi:hypothetical protein
LHGLRSLRTCGQGRFRGEALWCEKCFLQNQQNNIFQSGGRKAAGSGKLELIMTILDLAKATVVCGSVAFLTYSYPILSQVMVIGSLCLLWLLYAHRTLACLRRH